MSAFAVVFDQDQPLSVKDVAFADFAKSVADYKSLDSCSHVASGIHCAAAKFDTSCTLHKGIVVDRATDSWLLAVGTVIDNSDVESAGDLARLLEDYLEQGERVFQRLDGHFALVIYDRRNDSLLVVSDPFGLISIFYGQLGSRFIISTSALAIARAVQSKPDELGARFFLVLGAAVGERTLWQDVKRLLPATILRLTPQSVRTTTYWSCAPNPLITKLPLDESLDCVIDVLSRAMRRGLAREGKTWLSLTGGFDSRTLAALTDYCHLPFKTYCHGPSDSRDVQIAALISQKMGWEYEYFPLPEDWGSQRPSWLSRTLGQTDAHLDLWKTSRIIREQTLKSQQYSISLWGFGGETYRGFHWKQEFLNLGATSQVNYDRLLDFRIFSKTELPILKDSTSWVRHVREALKRQLMEIGEQDATWPNTVKLDLIGMFLEHAWGGAHISAVLGLQRAILPFNFKDSVACIVSVNHKWRTNGRLFRLILERVNPRLADINTADGGPASPMRLTNLHRFVPYWFGIGQKLIWLVGERYLGKSLWRKKDPGSDGTAYPLARWRRDTLSDPELQAWLKPEQMHTLNIFEPRALGRFLTQARKGDFDRQRLLGRVITLESALRSVGASFRD